MIPDNESLQIEPTVLPTDQSMTVPVWLQQKVDYHNQEITQLKNLYNRMDLRIALVERLAENMKSELSEIRVEHRTSGRHINETLDKINTAIIKIDIKIANSDGASEAKMKMLNWLGPLGVGAILVALLALGGRAMGVR